MQERESLLGGERKQFELVVGEETSEREEREITCFAAFAIVMHLLTCQFLFAYVKWTPPVPPLRGGYVKSDLFSLESD